MKKLPKIFNKIEIPFQNKNDICALSPAHVYDKWNAGIKSLEIGDNIINMYDVVGQDYYSGGGITAKSVAAQIRAIGDRPIEVHLNSPGGDMFEGIAIYNLLREHPQDVTVKVMGIAASAASIIAMAGNKIEIGAASFIMIHNCWVIAAGNQNDLIGVAEWLKPFDIAMAALYSQQTGISFDDISKMMEAETWISGNEAIENGFADSLLSTDQIIEDVSAKEKSTVNNALRQAEIRLCASMTRTDARALIAKIKSTPGAAPEAKPDAGEIKLLNSANKLLQTLKG
jgi:ATP-dependent Clp protease, protease subunit